MLPALLRRRVAIPRRVIPIVNQQSRNFSTTLRSYAPTGADQFMNGTNSYYAHEMYSLWVEVSYFIAFIEQN